MRKIFQSLSENPSQMHVFLTETCVDLAPPDQCYQIANVIPNGCSIYPESCRHSCGQCIACPIPDPVPSCSTGKDNLQQVTTSKPNVDL